MIDQIAVIRRAGIQEKVLIFQHTEATVLKPAQRLAAGFLHIQINKFHPGIRMLGRDTQARHERQRALANSSLRIGEHNGARFRQDDLVNLLRVFRVQKWRSSSSRSLLVPTIANDGVVIGVADRCGKGL